ncbi:ada2a-containing complex component 3 isoform d [Anaeramoeba flamelloides]|uniref:Ada2a-containing complex component 3 isoform d n=1 Tax=Anaeramoeba flamelloides TaxID=1746091 RepID=A0AAV7Z2L1_9EUKA|nr:ada2a-containing complex component 3 isoform d [Anaeramoeba flamelloides]
MSKKKHQTQQVHDLNPLLWYLCSVGDEGRLSLLLDSQKANRENMLHSKSPTGDTGLHYCVSGVNPHYECLYLMLSNRSNPNSKNKMDFSPLHISCAKGFTKCVSELLQNGADPDLVSKQGYRPIHYAIMGGYIDCIELLLQKKTKIYTDNDKMSILMTAARFGYYKLIPFLISKGTRVNFQSLDGTTALHIAAKQGKPKCCRELVKKLANVDLVNIHGQTALHLATKGGHLLTAKVLIELGSDPNSQDRYMETPLHISVKNNKLKITQMLLDSKANPHKKNHLGQTPLHLAANIGDTKLLMLLVDRGSNLFETDNADSSAYNYLIRKKHMDLLLIALDICLIKAAFINNLEIVEKLLNKGADPNGSNFCLYLKQQSQLNNKTASQPTYLSPISHRAASSHVRQSSPLTTMNNRFLTNSGSSQQSMKLQKSHLANLGQQEEDFSFLSNRFSNSIVSSVFGQNPSITEKLISCLGDINTRDFFTGDNCLHKAVMTNNLYLIKFCLERGVDQFVKNKAGITAFQLAKKLGLRHCVKYLYQSEEIYVNLLPGDKTPRIICGTTDRIVERFLNNPEFDEKSCYYFLLMHRYLINTKNLIQLFIDLFENAKEFVENCIFFPSKSKNKIKLVQLRILKIFQIWIEKIKKDFKQDKKFIIQLVIPFLKQNSKIFKKQIKNILHFYNNTNNKHAVNKKQIKNNHCKSKNEKDQELKNSKNLGLNAEPKPKSILSSGIRKKLDKKLIKGIDLLMDIHPLELSRQITLIEYKYYSKIGITELKNWSMVGHKFENKDQFPNLYKYDQHSRCFIHWIIYQVVKEKKQSQRVKRLIRLIEIASHLRELKNFSTVIQILEAFSHTPIARLTGTWNKIGKYSKMLNDLKGEIVELLLQSQYKTFFLHTTPPCIPYLDNFLDDLISLDLQNITKIGKVIHFDNYRRQFELLELLQKFQNSSYNFEPIKEIQRAFKKIKSIPFQRLLSLSLMYKK